MNPSCKKEQCEMNEKDVLQRGGGAFREDSRHPGLHQSDVGSSRQT